MMLTTSFALLNAAGACTERYRHLGNALGGIQKYGRTTPITLTRILETNGLDDALWALRAVGEHQAAERDRVARLFACWCARRVWHLLDDARSRTAVEVAERYAVGEATTEELSAAWDAARAAARAAARDAAWAAARDAAWAAAWAAARDAARDAAWAAAWDAAWAAAWDAARAAARAAARDAAWAAARDAQTTQFRAMLEGAS